MELPRDAGQQQKCRLGQRKRVADALARATADGYPEAVSDPARRGRKADKWVFLKRQAELEDRDRLLLDHWQRNVPWIARLYELKEQFFDIYAAANRAEAEDRLHHWLVGIPEEFEAWLQPILTYMTNWREEILNHFDHPYTNAGTEVLNGLVKLANRNGRGSKCFPLIE